MSREEERKRKSYDDTGIYSLFFFQTNWNENQFQICFSFSFLSS